MDQPCHSDEVVFTVTRHEPELVAPARPTPHELKQLSDIDDQNDLRFQIPAVFIYAHKPSMEGKDPALIIKKALSEALVFYYPFAGRLREAPAGKLMVDCNEEGVMFIEADGDATLEQFGHPLQPPFPQPPFPCFEEILYNVPGSDGIINCPILLFQVTRLKCGGFILVVRLNHVLSDALGFMQFMKAIAEIAQGALEPSITPVWCREILNARNPPRITHTHVEYQEIIDDATTDTMSYHSFFVSPENIKAIHQMFPQNNQHITRFEVLAAFLWRCRTKALQLHPDQEVRFLCVCNARTRSNTSFVPLGYYGNAIMHPAVSTTSKNLCENSLDYALELIKNAKALATREYLQSVADVMVTRGRPCFVLTRSSWLLSDLTRVDFSEVDFGWGKAVYGGPVLAGFVPSPEMSHLIASKNAQGEEGVVVQFYLPPKAMTMLVQELDDVFGDNKS